MFLNLITLHIIQNPENEDVGTEKRERILWMETIDLDRFEQELRYWVTYLESFNLPHHDFPE